MYYVNRFIILLVLFSLSFTVLADGAMQPENVNLSPKEMEKYITKMANHCWSLREKNTDSAIVIGKKALALAVENKSNKEIPRIYNFLGVLYLHYLPDNKTAIPYFHQALEIGFKNKDSVQMAYAYNNLGDAFMFTGNLALAYQYSESSLKIFKKLNHTSGIAYGYINLALVYREEGNYKLALDYFNRVKEMREALDDKTGLGSVLLEIAIVHQREGQLDKAEEFFLKSYHYHLGINNLRYASFCLSGMAENQYLKKEYNKAYEHYIQAIKLNDDRYYLYGQIDNYIGIALVYAQLDKRKEGEIVLNKALAISRSLDMPSNIVKSYKAFGTFYQILGDYKKATESLVHFLTFSDSILSIQQFEILNEIQTNFLVNQSLGKTQQELELRKVEEQYLIIIISLMLVLVVVFIWRFIAQRNMNRKLQQTNQVKDKLFSVISHDLKSPFNSLLGFSEILNQELNDKNFENATKYAGIINRSAEENLKLLNNLLNWSRSQTGRIKYNPKPMSFEHLFKELNDLFENDANNNSIQINFETSINQDVFGDVDILRIILGNLISNALKYTKKDGLVQVSARKSSSHIIINVIDNGLGMSQDDLNKLFDSSQSITTPGVRNETGTGLGLMLCAELIHIHKGQIKAKSELGAGSVFEIEFPIRSIS